MNCSFSTSPSYVNLCRHYTPPNPPFPPPPPTPLPIVSPQCLNAF